MRRYIPKRKGTIGKPPKLRGRPGQFFRDKNDQIYCCIMIYRLKEAPHIWIYVLEEREHTNNPSTELSRAIEGVTGERLNNKFSHFVL